MAEVAEISATSATNVSSAILSIQERGIDFQRERFLIRLSTDFCEHILRMSVGRSWRFERFFIRHRLLTIFCTKIACVQTAKSANSANLVSTFLGSLCALFAEIAVCAHYKEIESIPCLSYAYSFRVVSEW